MPPRLRLPLGNLRVRIYHHILPSQQCTYASLATTTTPAPPIDQTIRSIPPIARFPLNQPPSHKPPELRKSQLHRQYQSLLKSSPLILLFQHNNLLALEWMGIRRELAYALRNVDTERATTSHQNLYADAIKIQIIQTGIFASALRVVEFYHPESQPDSPTQHPSNPSTTSSARIPDTLPTPDDPRFTHGLSRRAHQAAANRKLKLELDPLLSGPLAVVAFPAVSPQHLKAALSILSSSSDFPAPKRKIQPSYHEPAVQAGLQKLMLLGARVEGKVFDQEGTKWVGSIPGGIDGLRAQLVAMLQNTGASVTNILESAGRSLYLTMEGRKCMLEGGKKETETEKRGE
ncbi:hypothetical protein AOQ84DRAFT_152232 [Glonium stellatum]|uniref:Uncharacterized protein n=1 Tax=Glonium stellatum TaxID=574774 RepID=A0A8E2FDH6_9PEZI|nr:hypothetical protein AOQ84DRAFT_152232 [Glonium stellatum]